MRHVLITGGTGQVGTCLQRLSWPPDVQLHAPLRADLDLSDSASIPQFWSSQPWSAVLHCGAFTHVDLAQSRVSEAFMVNSQATASLAELCGIDAVPLIYLSTDYVFDGQKSGAYSETDHAHPINLYGASKLAGEWAVRTAHPRSVILRTSWIFSDVGRNFVKTMIRLAKDGHPELRVISDQIGHPTYAHDIAQAVQHICLRLLDDSSAPHGIYHFTNGGATSWHGLASAVMQHLKASGMAAPDVQAIGSSDYISTTNRPANSCLSNRKIEQDYGIQARSWQQALAELMAKIIDAKQREDVEQ